MSIAMLMTNSYATNYYSTQDGLWSSPTWSRSGHNSSNNLTTIPCNLNGNDSIFIMHNINNLCGTVVSFGGNAILVIRPSAQLSLGGLDIGGSFKAIIQPIGCMVINGDLTMTGNTEIVVDGSLVVNGNVALSRNAYVCGHGMGHATGTISTRGNSSWCQDLLSIELAHFEISQREEGVLLEWVTVTELSNELFVIERSFDGQIFEEIDDVLGAGDSDQPLFYNYIDNAIFKDIEWVYYRIKQIDFDGQFSYSKTAVIAPIQQNFNVKVQIYPNPTTGYFIVQINEDISDGTIQIYDMLGNLKESLNLKGQRTEVSLQNWVSGTYVVVINIGNEQSRQKIVVY